MLEIANLEVVYNDIILVLRGLSIEVRDGQIVALLGKSKDLIKYVKDRVGHDRRYSVNGDKLRALGYEPEVSLEDGLERTVHWYRDNDWWWKKVRNADFQAYYQRQYVDREKS